MQTLRTLRTFLAIALLFLSTVASAAIQLTPVVPSGLASPVFVGHAGDGSNRLFIIEQAGVIRVLQPYSSTPTTFLDIRSKILAGDERGLLGLAFHPQYATNGRFFVYYTRTDDGTIVIAEYGVSGNPNVANTTETILLTIPHPTNANHNGGMLAFGPDTFLYAGVGDGGSGNDPPNNAQNINTLLGKILRIDVDHPDTVAGTAYSSPSDNPYFGAIPGRDEIFSIGWRNPWRFSFDRLTHEQWVADVGQGAREEVDTPIVKGGNYGWRVYEGTQCTGNDPLLCNPGNYIFPIFDYTHSGGRCSITGGYVYRGGALPQGTYVYGDYCSGEIFAWNGATQSVLLDTTKNISSFGEDEAGEVYVVNHGGALSRIAFADTPKMCSDLSRDGRTDLAGLTSGGRIFYYSSDLGIWVNPPGILSQLVTADFNGDGQIDLAGLTSSGDIFYTVDRSHWTKIPGVLNQLVSGDFNGDGHADLAGLTSAGGVYYTTDLQNWVNIPGTLSQLVPADLDGDGRTDLAGLTSGGLIFYYSSFLGSWVHVPGILSQLVAADFNGDGQIDLAGLTSSGDIFYTVDRSHWTKIPGVLNQLVSGDFNGDGHADLAGLTSAGGVYYTTDLQNWVNIPGNLSLLATGDFNGDGRTDLAGLSSGGNVYYTTNLSTWTNVSGQLSSICR